eukprot:245470_1
MADVRMKMLFSTLMVAFIVDFGNAIVLLYDEEKQVASSKIQCPDNDVCDVFITGKEASHTSTIHCPLDQNCNIACNGERSCFRSIIYCPVSADCVIKCNGKYSCRYFTVNSPSTGNALRIECNEYLGCADANILAANNAGGLLHISGSNSKINYMLDGSSIVCPRDGKCEVNASGYQAMKDTFINATLARTLHVKSSGKEALMNSKIYCPNSEQACIVEIHSKKFRILYETEIYAVESFKDLKLICDGHNCNKKLANGGIHAPVLFCNAKFDDNCKLKFTNGALYCATRSQCQNWKVYREL